MLIGNMFNEICKVSTMNATKALSKIIQTPVGVRMDSVEINHLQDFNNFLNPSDVTVNLSLPITGKIPGMSFLLYPEESALTICDILFNRKKGLTKTFSEPEISALSEIANIVIGNFLTSFAQSLQIDFLIHRSANFSCAPFKEIYNQIMQKLAECMKKTVFKISFSFQHLTIQGQVLIILDEDKINTVLEKISKSSSA